jgi:hypothetical protein
MKSGVPTIVQLICELAEASDNAFRESLMEAGSLTNLRLLTNLGVIKPGPRPATVTCTACTADHLEVIEYDADWKCYIHSCPDAGIVRVDNADLVTHHFQTDWLLRWLMKTLPITSPNLRPPLVAQRIWHLGDTVCGDTLVTVVFARRLVSQAELDQLASVLRPIYRAVKGVVITTSPHIARQVKLPGGYELLPLIDVATFDSGQLIIDLHRLAYWINGMESTTAKGAPSREGRPSSAARVERIFGLRRSRGVEFENDSAEARAIRAEWKEHVKDKVPGFSTVRRHVAKLAAASA